MKIINRVPKTKYKWQKEVFNNLTRFNVIVAPRQHGKTELVCEVIAAVAYSKKISYPVISLGSDKKSRVYKLYSGRLDEIFGEHDDYKWSNEATGTIKIKRKEGDHITINIFGSVADPDGFDGTAAHLTVIDEAGLTSSAFIEESAFPSTAKTGGINIVTGTVEPNHYQTLYYKARKKMLKDKSKNWYAFFMAIGDQMSVESLGEKRIEEIEDSFDFDNAEDRRKYEKEYMCNWMAGVVGTPYSPYYLKAVEEERIGESVFNKDLKVGTTWDDGRGTTAVWFWQFEKGQFNFIDYKEWKESNIPEICDDVKAFYDDLDAEMGFHILPHTTAERSYTERSQLSRRKQIKMEFFNKGIYIYLKKVTNLETKLNAGKEFFSVCKFDEFKCFDGLRSLQFYARKTNAKRTAFRPGIADNKFSHGGDAFGELAMAWKLGRLDERLFEKATPSYFRNKFDPFRPTRPY